MYFLYRTATHLVSPFVPALLRKRLACGKEDAGRLQERLGYASIVRPAGRLVWIHAASVGETNSVLPLIQALLAAFPSLCVLLTTVTVTSASMLRGRLPDRAFHQFAVVDTPQAVERFLAYWHPDIALWVDSELWPNTIMATRRKGTVMGIINARMSEKSFRTWHLAKGFIRPLLSSFSLCFAQSPQDRDRLLQLGMPKITGIGNLKYDAPPLPCDEQELNRLKAAIEERPVWVAASTHPGEEEIIGNMHKVLQSTVPSLLTVIVPRHAARGNDIASELKGFQIAQRSRGDSIRQDTDIYLADTMGELGLFYTLAPVVFIGGTLVRHGGQNPLEAARMGCAIIIGPHFHNFTSIVRDMEQDKAILCVTLQEELERVLAQVLTDSKKRRKLGDAARKHVASRGGAIRQIMNVLQPYLT